MSGSDTICAVSTPPGAGGIGIIRISGSAAIASASALFAPQAGILLADAPSHTLHYGHIRDHAAGETVDEVLVSVMRAPATYTREDVVEINCHGGPAPLARTLELLLAAGIRQAEPGEFTMRAFLNGRIDLVQAESVMDVITAKTDLSRRAAMELLQGGLSGRIAVLRDQTLSLLASVEAGVDFPEEDIETDVPMTELLTGLIGQLDDLLAGSFHGRIVREGCATAIIGKPNVGKSSLLNALLMQNRAIVTEIAGTTRDVLEDYLNIEGIPFRVLDTAGIRHSHDVIEQEGVRRSFAALESADLVLIVFDGSRTMTDEDSRVLDAVQGKHSIAVMNKSDLPKAQDELPASLARVAVSCRTGEGLDHLKRRMADAIKTGAGVPREHAWAVNARHKAALEQARDSLHKALGSAQARLSPEFIAVDLRGALDSLGLIIGATYTEDILDHIFSRFCIGK